jgi:putative MATE family efflux protein
VEAANRVVGQVFLLSVILGGFFLLVSILFAVPVARLSGAPDDVNGLSEQYLVILGWGMPFFILGLIGRNVFHASGDAIRPMIFTIFGQVCNAILDPFFIFGWWFFPEMGIGGAALATVISNILSVALALYYVLAGKTPYRLQLHHLVPNIRVIFDIYHVGLPAAVMQMTESIVFALFNHVVAGFGSVALAAVGIAARLSDLAFMPIIGTGQGLLPIIGFSLGAKLWDRLWGAVKLASIWMMVLMGIATILFEVFAPQTVALFNKDPELLAIAVPGMRIFLSTLIVIGPAIMFITTFQGLGKGKDALVLSLARQFIFFLPVMYVLAHFLGLTGVWLSMPVSDILGVTTSGLWLYREYRRQKGSLELRAQNLKP